MWRRIARVTLTVVFLLSGQLFNGVWAFRPAQDGNALPTKSTEAIFGTEGATKPNPKPPATDLLPAPTSGDQQQAPERIPTWLTMLGYHQLLPGMNQVGIAYLLGIGRGNARPCIRVTVDLGRDAA